MLVTELGGASARDLISDSVYFISIGSNDYILGYLSDDNKRASFTPQEFIGMVIGNLTQSIQVRTLHASFVTHTHTPIVRAYAHETGER